MPSLSLRCCLAALLTGLFASPVFGQVADPSLSVSAGPTAETVTVSVAHPIPSVTLHYTTDGTPPTTSSSQVPGSGTLVVNLNSTLKVQAYQASATPSNVVSARYTSNDRISSGSQHSLVLKRDGTLWAWGNNTSGQLGTTTNRPAQVPFTGANPILGIVSTTVPFANGTTQNPAYDGDSDGMPDAWERQYFGNTTAEASADPDRDGLTNLQEYQQGSDPNDFFNNLPPVLSIVDGNNQGDLPGTTLARPLAVRVANHRGTPKPDISVAFSIQSGSGQLVPIGGGGTDAGGTSKATLQLPTTAGATVLVDAVFGGSGVTFTATVGDPSVVPNAPSDVICERQNPTAVLVKWNDNSNNETAFYVERSEDNQVWQRLLPGLSANTTEFLDTGLTVGGVYSYRIVAHNEAP